MSDTNTVPNSPLMAGCQQEPCCASCATCQHWSGNEYPPAYEKAYCEIFDKDTAGNHGKQCTAYQQVISGIDDPSNDLGMEQLYEGGY